ncbi:hypothetical protein KR222_006949 [Zaprionus bogoriensis]|nr:hypothetical protein KR222_006949 [Zaprionus bogoriensis]
MSADSRCSARLHRQASLPVGSRCIVPLLHIWLRLNNNHYSAGSAYFNRMRLRCSHRLRLEQRSLLQNMCLALTIYCRECYQSFFPAARVSASSVGTQTERKLTSAFYIKQDQSKPIGIYFVKKVFLWISKILETALVAAGSTPRYINTSAAMELLDLGSMYEELNSALIDHLVEKENDYFMITPVPSLSLFSQFDRY